MKITKSMIDHPHRIKEPTPEKQGSWQGRNLKELALACKKKLQRVYAYIRYKDFRRVSERPVSLTNRHGKPMKDLSVGTSGRTILCRHGHHFKVAKKPHADRRTATELMHRNIVDALFQRCLNKIITIEQMVEAHAKVDPLLKEINSTEKECEVALRCAGDYVIPHELIDDVIHTPLHGTSMSSLIEALHNAGAQPGKDPATVNAISHKDEKLLAHLFKQATLAVASLHEKGYAHRDIKPQNFVIDGKAHLKLIGFGLARTAGDPTIDLTIKDYNPADFVLHIALCPPGYRAPDDLIFQNVNLKAEDAWSLGVLLTEMFTGKRYFYRSDLSEAVETIEYKLDGRDEAIAEMVRMGVNKKAIQLAEALLHHNPSQRMTVAEALKSPFLEDVDLAAFGT
ncbi:protein kinase [Thalassotalea sp. G20_0]|uniref:protein kinase domain-containing protein n=1 Tax=Thalassotalea sp. G20_0 TaxID=2821093 RepID=UPI001ADC944C|nr:protein kinase [Thalassotalea sp. G20_0]MBO9495156.1 protein kinase [Thalassotalea sp. G20_0]